MLGLLHSFLSCSAQLIELLGKQKPFADDSHRHLLSPHPPLPASASCEEVRSILEFRKGIKSHPSDLFFSSWIPPASSSACYDDLYDAICYTAASAVVVAALDGLDLTCELKFWIPARRSVISTDRVCPRRCEETKGDCDLGRQRWMGKGDKCISLLAIVISTDRNKI
ncbi:leucine-rich receptor-like protein kinase family protein [Striga asiatica]|uniref:Leucine-rich receptor-like protein kinase family protein n=1 Tax=Striga asiatica TaxID=4170 RepID=A0A5A7R658_STRAF|nr:leucine-rich receptor-like protein kinase family protein [Striga asiatica]